MVAQRAIAWTPLSSALHQWDYDSVVCVGINDAPRDLLAVYNQSAPPQLTRPGHARWFLAADPQQLIPVRGADGAGATGASC